MDILLVLLVGMVHIYKLLILIQSWVLWSPTLLVDQMTFTNFHLIAYYHLREQVLSLQC